MVDIQQTGNPIDWEVDKKKVPETLNVLTILTFIGSGLFGLIGLWGLLKPSPTETELQETQERMDKAPDFMKSIIGPHAVEMARKTAENRIPLLVLTVVAIVLCIYGAIQMRALKKQGFYIYVIGEIVIPLISMFVFVGIGLYGGFNLFMSLFFPLLFIVLYATQLKRLN